MDILKIVMQLLYFLPYPLMSRTSGESGDFDNVCALSCELGVDQLTLRIIFHTTPGILNVIPYYIILSVSFQ